MAKGLAVIQGANKVVFKALENGTIHLGSTAVAASVELIGSLKLDITGKDTGHFLKSVDADGNAQWAQVTAADVDVAASGLDLESHLSVMAADELALSTDISIDIAEEAAARVSADQVLDGRLTTAETNIGSLQLELSTLIGGSTEEFGQTLSTIKEIQEYLDGDGTNVQELVSVAGTAIGDLTSFTAGLSVDLSSQISALDTGSGAGLSTEISQRVAGDEAISANLSAELVDRAAGDAEISANLSAELVDRAAADAGLQAEISANLSSSIVDVDGTANEVEVSIIDSVNGKTAVVGLPDNVSVQLSMAVGGDLDVAGTANLNGDVNLGNDVTTDSVVVSGTFQAPKLTRNQAIARYSLTTTETGYDAFNGHMFYLNDDDDTGANAILPEGQKWYFCEGGVWHASFFYYA